MYELLGKYQGKFTNRQGEEIIFCRFYAQRLDPPDGVIGLMTEEFRVPADLFGSVDVGAHFKPFYNKYGRIEGFADVP